MKAEHKMVTIGIDATNLIRGGGRTHLIELLRAAEPEAHGIKQIIVWGSRATLATLDDRSWLKKENSRAQEGGLMRRSLWQRFSLSSAARNSGCNVLFVPGGSYAGDFRPVVTMSRNMLPFEWQELKRYGPSLVMLRVLLLRLVQSRTFRRSDGVIFLTHYAKSGTEKVTGPLEHTTIISHGMNSRFMMAPKPQRAVETYSADDPFRIMYVSIIDQYKHQWSVVEAIARLRKDTGWHLRFELAGPAYQPALQRLQAAIDQHDPGNTWVRYHGAVPFQELHGIYRKADLGLFASSCESISNILLETMAAGLPMACSDRGPMPEILGDAGVYFDPERPSTITAALRQLLSDPDLRARLAAESHAKASGYSWQSCAEETFEFVVAVARSGR